MKKTIVLLLFAIFLLQCVYSQNNMWNRQQKKFVFTSSIGFMSGMGSVNFDTRSISNKSAMFFIDQMLGYQFNNYFSMGLITGFDFWRKTAFIPLAAHVHVNFIDRRLSPHFLLNMGYAFQWHSSQYPDTKYRVIYPASQGVYGESGLGLTVRMNDRISFLLSLIYKVQHSSIKYSVKIEGASDMSQYYTNREQKLFYHFMGLRLGVYY